ncbi:efflux RND transporter permease subunit [filamentous cyanobacterium LEGE 11480]|uniref:Efflux RND transporter permease subunit n=1 Tax=Romeriopsis navalis LEGE 11480 TaxID=2777977 RepID=A0A928VU84_9CYAN|nr:efflux RND transporter permease subunit [Romeriopsis navalis]MBE9032632.1 efflux RND transporter permease subunit [Romeriopsis navalis LEGE 11480]
MLNQLLDRILRGAIARRWLVVLAAIVITLWGSFSVGQMPLDVFPAFAPPQVDIHTEASGLAPEDIEAQITLPIERAVNGLPGVEVVRSSSKVGLSMVSVVFDQDADVYRSRQLVTERLQSVRLPETLKPAVSPLTSPLGIVLQYAFTLEAGSDQSLGDLRQWVESSLSNQILSVPGVTQVNLYGGEQSQTQIVVNPAQLREQNVSLNQVTEAVAANQARSTGGFLIGGGQELLVRSVKTGNILYDDLRQSIVKSQAGQTVRLQDVAQIREGSALKRGDGSFNGKSAVVMMITKQPRVDTPTVTKAVEAVVESAKAALPTGIAVQQTFRQANFIDMAIRNVSGSLVQGIVIVAIVMLLFLMNWRTAVITLSAIPLSLLVGLMLMQALGLGLNTMTLGGLVVAIGSVVDDAIVDMENCYRGLRRNQREGNPQHPLEVVYETSVQVRRSVIFSTVIIAVVFAPIFTLSGVEGRIFGPMGLAYLLAIGASTLVAVTLSPALCGILLANQQLPAESSWMARQAERLYRPVLNLSLKSPQWILGIALALLVATIAVVPSLGRVFLPEFQEKSLVNSMVLFPGVSLDATQRAGITFEKLLQNNPKFDWVQVRSGRTPGDPDGAGVNIAHVDVELSDAAMQNRDAAIRELRETFDQLPGVAANVGGFISHRMDEVLSGVRSAIAIKIYGDDLGQLRSIGEKVRDIVKPIDGIVDLQLEPQLPTRQVHIEYDRAKIAQSGLTMQAVSEVVETALNGRVALSIPYRQQQLDGVVMLSESARNNLDALRAIPLTTPQGKTVSLGDVAKIDYGMGPNEVNRENVSRRIVVSANVADRDLGSVVEAIQAQVKQQVKLPQGYFIQYGGQFEAEQQATRNLVLFSALAAVVISVLMCLSVKSLPATVAIMINLPLALVGGVVSILLSGGVMSIASLVGFITLFGVAVRNGLLLVDSYNRKFALGLPLQQVIVEGSLERINAILMTALTSALGMLPLALSTGAGNEILRPLAIVVLGGLFTSTALTLMVLPALYARFGLRLRSTTGPNPAKAV